jgi:hypothetical protein
VAFRNAFKAKGVKWRYYSGQRNGEKCHTYIPEHTFPTIRSDKRLKPKEFDAELERIINTELRYLLKETPCQPNQNSQDAADTVS